MAEFLADDGLTDVEQVRPVHITGFLAHEIARGLKPASISVILRTLRRYFQFCVEQEIIESNPARKVMAPRVVIEPVTFLSDDQVTTLLAKIGKATVEDIRDAAMFRVLASGMRRGELIGLRVTDVDLDQRTVTIRAITSKTRNGRTVAISTDAVKHLKTYLKVREAFLARNGRQAEQALWISHKGALAPNGALEALRRRLKAAGLPQVTLHSFRHKMAAEATQKGVPLSLLMSHGGWSSPAMPTMRYGQFGIEGRAIEAMQALLDR